MSGGGNKKKITRSQGWEEAGSEFYQECYPADSEIDVIHRDPKHLATLLPSKQTRAAIATIRIRTADYRTNNRTVRKRTATRTRSDSTFHRRTSAAGDIQVSMLPDLSEMRTNEKTAWEEVLQIKALPVTMAQKKEMKSKILTEPNFRLQGYEQFKWKRRKMWDQLESRISESFHKMELWKNALKHIEGNFGTGVVAFFLFLKWLLFLNILIFTFIFLFTVLPALLLNDNGDYNCTEWNTTSCCSESYFNQTLAENNVFLDVLQGTGVMERTVFYYGYYSNKVYSYMAGEFTLHYNMPLAYMLVTVFYFLFSLIAILRSATKGFRDRLVEGEGQFYKYCNLVLGGWDFCIDNKKAAMRKHKAVFSEIKANLETERLEEERKGRTRKEKYKIYFSRFVVNVIALALLAVFDWIIYLVFQYSTTTLQDYPDRLTVQGTVDQLFYEFLPSITIVSFNVIIPFVFRYLVSFEKYTPTIQLRVTLIRTVFFKMASVIVLYASLSIKISCAEETSDQSCTRCGSVPVCWETFVGQQMLKLLLTDFGTHIFLTFMVNFPRSLLAKHVDNRFCKMIGEQTFDLPTHALDIVYIQTLCWFGTFYAPFLSLLSSIILFLMFYIKKFACLVNCRPSSVIYRASRSNSLFMLVLLVSYCFAIFPMAYSVSELVPSRSCGPFRDVDSVWTLVVDFFLEAPHWLRNIIFFLSTAGFAIPCFIVLSFLLYYYTAVCSANRHMVLVLKNQLVLEGHDKQFLLDRLSLFIKQENQKRVRAEQMTDDRRNT